MLNLTLRDDAPFLNVLCVGAHADDIEIGCGGTILKLIEQLQPKLRIYWVVFSANKQRTQEACRSAEIFLKHNQHKTISIKNFRDGFFPFLGSDIKDCFEAIKSEFFPDIIFTHYRNDLHQDHRLISELTWNTFRNHLILEYEIPKYDGDLSTPNFFVHLSQPICDQKIQTILETFTSQRDKPWFSEDLFRSLLRIRGMESVAPSKYAEAFYCRKMVFLDEGN